MAAPPREGGRPRGASEVRREAGGVGWGEAGGGRRGRGWACAATRSVVVVREGGSVDVRGEGERGPAMARGGLGAHLLLLVPHRVAADDRLHLDRRLGHVILRGPAGGCGCGREGGTTVRGVSSHQGCGEGHDHAAGGRGVSPPARPAAPWPCARAAGAARPTASSPCAPPCRGCAPDEGDGRAWEEVGGGERRCASSWNGGERRRKGGEKENVDGGPPLCLGVAARGESERVSKRASRYGSGAAEGGGGGA